MYCPLKMIPRMLTGGTSSVIICNRVKCAWWVTGVDEGCALNVIARQLKRKSK